MHRLPLLWIFAVRLRTDVLIRLQKKLAKKILICPLTKEGERGKINSTSSSVPPILNPKNSPWLIAATDLGIKGDTFKAAIVVYELKVFSDRPPSLELIDEVVYRGNTSSIRFPYIPGFLSFREIPPLLKAFKKLSVSPDVILCDGQGIAHPRGVGLASHLGLTLRKPSVGCAKNKLCGNYGLLPPQKGSWVPLVYDGLTVGVVYRSRTGVKPIYISPGHLTDIPSSIALVELCLGRFRIPEPLRRAHILSNSL
ncbi:MAG: endonuclease V [Syntrophobacterales bacterium]|nr:endonuclease V [Syntrophobacterales bacterium]